MQLCNGDYDWVGGDFAAGDVLTFSSQTVHRSLPNQQPGRIRLSCDFRYQPAAEEIEAASLRVHCGVLDWDQVYDGWQSGAIQYYWKRHDLTLAPWDETIRWQKERICS